MAGVLNRRMFKMANGGMMPPEMAMMPPGPPPMDPGMAQEMEMAAMAEMLPAEVLQAASQDMSQATQEVAAEEINAAAGEEAAATMAELDTAGDYRDIMNAVWDDGADIEAYRNRLADVVGWEDADRTPDSVLALVQPTLQLAEIDKGIGALMQEELAEVGEIDGGITELATKSAVADNMAAETGALVNAVSGMAPTDRPSEIDDMRMMAEMDEPLPMDQGIV